MIRSGAHCRYDTGACDTVVPQLMCPGIPITPSAQSLRGMGYEVATGESMPNLGEKRCDVDRRIVGSEVDRHAGGRRPQNASQSQPLCRVQVWSCFWFLIDTVTGEVR